MMTMKIVMFLIYLMAMVVVAVHAEPTTFGGMLLGPILIPLMGIIMAACYALPLILLAVWMCIFVETLSW